MKKALYKDNIYFHNDYIDMIVENPDDYDYNDIFYASVLSIVHRKKLLDYLFKQLIITSYKDVNLLREKLINQELYLEYIDSIINSNDSFLKTCLFLYFEPDLKDELFDNNNIILNTIINSNEGLKLKLSNIFNLSQYPCDEDTYSKLKKSFTDLFLDIYEDQSDEYKIKALEKYYELMDKNQTTVVNGKILKKNK